MVRDVFSQVDRQSHVSLTEVFSFYVERLGNLETTNYTLLLENGTCQIHLACVLKNQSQTVSVEWQATGNISLGGPNVTIFWDPRNSGDQTYVCRAKNAVSNLSVSVSTQSLCKGNVGTKNGGPWGREGGKNHILPEFHLCSGQADVGGLPDAFHSAPGGHPSL
jgi:hypothetical protein